MTYTFDEDLISDLHKEAYGFRPSQSFWAIFAASNGDQKQAIWDDLIETLKATVARALAEQAQAIERFERRVFELRSLGAKSLDMAISWLHQAYETDGDDEFLEYHLDLPYGYIKRSRAFQAIAREEAAY